MNKGELFSVHLDGTKLTVCVVGFYQDEDIGEEVVILAVVNKDQMLHIPVNDLHVGPPLSRQLN